MAATEIYYFSGKGNSLFAARELQKRIPGSELVPVIHLLQQAAIRTGAPDIGFVFPIHFARVPVAMRDFFREGRFCRRHGIFLPLPLVQAQPTGRLPISMAS